MIRFVLLPILTFAALAAAGCSTPRNVDDPAATAPFQGAESDPVGGETDVVEMLPVQDGAAPPPPQFEPGPAPAMSMRPRGPEPGVSPPSEPSPPSNPGQVTEYTVQPGDSLWKIARAQNSTVESIRQANGLLGDTIRVGQTLRVPSR